jgi:hypothetical protein
MIGKPFGVTYSRVFRSAIVYTKEDMLENICRWNGKDQCYVSLNEFNVIDGINPAWTYAIYDRMLVECDFQTIKKLIEIINTEDFKQTFKLGYSIWYAGEDQFYWFFLLPEENDKIYPLTEQLELFMKNKYNLGIIVNRKPEKKILMLGTYNMLTKRVVTSIGESEIKQGIQYIDRITMKK